MIVGASAGIVGPLAVDVLAYGGKRLVGVLIEHYGPEIGKLLPNDLDKFKDVILSIGEGYIENPGHISIDHVELQKYLVDALVPEDYRGEVSKFTEGLWDVISDVRENEPIDNKIKGREREIEFYESLLKDFLSEHGYVIEDEVYLRDSNGEIVKDSVTGEARRVDFVVMKDGKVIESYEVTSLTAPKEDQMGKEARIRENGGNYVKDSNTGELIPYGEDVKTEVIRLA